MRCWSLTAGWLEIRRPELGYILVYIHTYRLKKKIYELHGITLHDLVSVQQNRYGRS